MIRQFEEKDKSHLLEFFNLNSPQYFAPSEKPEYEMFLAKHADQYFVFEENDLIKGAGGINFKDEETVAYLSWDIVNIDFHGEGIGRKLTGFRIELIKKTIPQVRQITVRTSQLVYPFYEKMGFSLVQKEKNYWAPDFDLYEMKMDFF